MSRSWHHILPSRNGALLGYNQGEEETFMCAACVEYGKEKLTLDEFKSALKEAAIDAPAHKEKVERLIRDYGNQPDVLRRAVQPKPEDPKDY